jgi:tetratricopeptide (TPR) repeat protein
MSSKTTTAAAEQQHDESLAGKRVAIVGKLAGMSRREAQQLIREHGGVAVDSPAPEVQIVVVGEQELPLALDSRAIDLDDATRTAVDEGRIEVIVETQLWQRLGLVEAEQHVHQLYTPAMLADLLQVPLAIVRRWHRRGLIVPRREVRRLPYFDFQEVATARRLAELLAAGMSPQAIEKKLAALVRYVPGVERPLAQLSVIVEGKQLLLRQGDGLIAPGGQLWFNFSPRAARSPADRNDTSGGSEEDARATADSPPVAEREEGEAEGGDDAVALPLVRSEIVTPEELLNQAATLEDEGQLVAAAEMYRAALMGGGPVPEVCFALAELLYRMGDTSAARERYYMAIELDEEYVEARANLGCVLAESGERELAVAAFEGALAFHDQYPDVHYHLARTLDDLDRRPEADRHWRTFLELAPESPWAETARRRLSEV